ncbi:hypothetical protein CRG98_050184, partial [Punica granatum]
MAWAGNESGCQVHSLAKSRKGAHAAISKVKFAEHVLVGLLVCQPMVAAPGQSGTVDADEGDVRLMLQSQAWGLK